MITANDANTQRRHVVQQQLLDDNDDDDEVCDNDDDVNDRSTRIFAAPVLYLLLISRWQTENAVPFLAVVAWRRRKGIRRDQAS